MASHTFDCKISPNMKNEKNENFRIPIRRASAEDIYLPQISISFKCVGQFQRYGFPHVVTDGRTHEQTHGHNPNQDSTSMESKWNNNAHDPMLLFSFFVAL